VRLETNRGYGAPATPLRELPPRADPYVWWLNNDLTFETGQRRPVRHMEATPAGAAAGAVTVDEETGRRVLGAGMDLTLWRGRVRHRHTESTSSSCPVSRIQST
jgi:hypothetical protein